MTRKVPGLEDFEIYEHESDPIALVSYDVEDAKTKDTTSYARDPKGEGFVKHPNSLDAVPSPDGRYLARVGKKYVEGHDMVEITDLRTGVRTQVRTAREPLQATFELWSRDSRRILFSLEREVDKKWRAEGYVIVTVGEPNAQVVRPGVIAEDYYWTPSGDQVVAEVQAGKSARTLHFFTPEGDRERQITGVGAPPEDDMYSPSGRSFVTNCPDGKDGAVCVFDSQTGEQVRRIATDCSPLLGWYDDEHLICWTEREDAFGRDLIEVLDFTGKRVRTLLAVSDGSLLYPTFHYKPEYIS